jgi:hypothetical protein
MKVGVPASNAPTLNARTTLLLTRIPTWLWYLLLAEADRHGVGYWRLVNHALERELLYAPAGIGDGSHE